MRSGPLFATGLMAWLESQAAGSGEEDRRRRRGPFPQLEGGWSIAGKGLVVLNSWKTAGFL